jgi:peptidoglycan/LPS O-acetylase OafA/YrhL
VTTATASPAAARAFGQGEIRCFTGLRGCAAILVMLYHFSFSMPPGTLPPRIFLRNGYLWVDLFFVLSGFVMAYSQAALFAGGDRLRGYARFLMTRIARVYPLYALVIVESACLLAWRATHPDVGDFVRVLLLNLALVQAWGLAPSLEGAAWSISAEWGAYLAFPLLLWVTVSASRRLAATVAALAMLAIIGIAVSPGPFALPDQSRAGPLDIYSHATMAPLVRCIAEFTLGLVAFRVARHLSRGPLAWAGPTALATAALLVIALSQRGADVCVVALFAVLLVSLAPRRGLVDRLLAGAVPYRLGQWSYSIYLIHDKFSHLAGLLREQLAGRVPIASVVAVTLTGGVVIACGATTFFLVERPARNLLLGVARRLSDPGARPAAREAASPAGGGALRWVDADGGSSMPTGGV